MREILFRAWDKKEKKYIDIIGFYVFDNSIDLWFIDKDDCPNFKNYPCDRIILEQYTGLKDKNGVKIFEGDKIRFKNLIHNHRTGVIKYAEKWAQFYVSTKNKHGVGVGLDSVHMWYYTEYAEKDRDTECEVIGNIHE